jgi:SAM-dependent methyltransferase
MTVQNAGAADYQPATQERASEGTSLEPWVLEILADPLTKLPATAVEIGISEGVIDARRFMKNTIGFVQWDDGQSAYEGWEQATVEDYKKEREVDAPVYEHIKMSGRVLDVGGSVGAIRQFLPNGTQFISVDPFIGCTNHAPPAKTAVYPCLGEHLNFIAACAEFLPFKAQIFDWVHMRSMLDHVHSPDLALMEARRILKPTGRLVIGLYVDGGKHGHRTIDRQLKEIARPILTTIGFKQFKDHHLFHPTFKNLQKIILDNGFTIDDVYWQPAWRDTVCYITAAKSR